LAVNGRAAHWLLSALVAAFLIGVYTVVLAAVRPQVVLAGTAVTLSFTADSKTYDANTNATILGCAVTGGVTEGDDVGCQVVVIDDIPALADFDDKNAGENKVVTAANTDFELTGEDAAAYEVGSVESTTANITERDLTADATGVNKVYDGNTTAAVTFTDDRVGGDTFDYTYDAIFADKNVANDKSVSVSDIAISGTDAGNYNLLTTSDSTTANITKRDLTADATGVDRGYDGGTAATVTFTDDRIDNDVLDYSYTAAFDNRNAGVGKGVNVSSIAISGADAGNYNLLTTSDSTTADVDQAPLTVTAVANVKVADGTTTAAAIPSVSGTIYTPDSANFIETYDTAAAGGASVSDKKTLTPSGAVMDGNGGDNYAYTFVPQAVGQIRPAPAASVEFVTQPINTKTGTPIYSVCVPSGGTAPCALAGATSTTSTSIKVLAKDAFGNNAGPGSPGADETTDDVNVRIRRDNSSGATVANVNTSNGVADFADLLVISAVGPNNGLHAAATSGATASPTPASSDTFTLVNDLKACEDQECDNSASNSGNPGIPAAKVQKAFGEITTDDDFFDDGSSALSVSSLTTATNVLFSTEFVDGDQTNQAVCGNTAAGKTTIGQATDMLISGVGAAEAQPDTTMVLIMPKDALKAYAVTARSASSFNVCLGAKRLTPGPGWKAKVMTGKKPTGLFTTTAGAEGRYWGAPADCGAPGLGDDPCIGLRTKQVATARTYLVTQKHIMTDAEFNALNIRDADLVVIVEKTSPWDGKSGLY
jgi:hypothetical protein